MSVDILAIGAHPDDIELGIGGLIAKLAREGRTIALLDLTRGEMGTRGTPELRAQEAEAAAKILGVAHRENANLPDGGLANTSEQQQKIIPFLRKFRPAVILAPMAPDRHPDHQAAHALVRDANFFAGLEHIDTGQKPHRTPQLFFYHPYFEHAMPTWIANISSHFSTKMDALRAYASQFHNPSGQGPETFISSKSFWDSIQTRAAYWGSRIGAAHGEALYADGPIRLDHVPGL
ncbi:MAG TPA: bacillithiol biosynthesis deacetylase BshB1 [Candidatus Hydrogenedentes bacterium]|nr:bacillithiol biosynthesis deacetylase BshB1 [Candidatus Hydrogenedentota bacterium]